MNQGEDCHRLEQPKPAERAEPNLLSLAIFVAGLFGVLLIPTQLQEANGPGRRVASRG